MKQTVIYFVRHGETNYPYSNNQDIDDERELTARGIEQALTTGRYLRGFDVGVIYTSPRKRCQQTADHISKETGVDKIVIDDRIDEDYGKLSENQFDKQRNDFINDVAVRYSGERIVAVTHQYHLIKLLSDYKDIETLPGFCSVVMVVLADTKIVQIVYLPRVT